VFVKLDMSEAEEKALAEKAKLEAAALKSDEVGKTKLGIEVKKDVDLAEWYR